MSTTKRRGEDLLNCSTFPLKNFAYEYANNYNTFEFQQ